MPLHPVGDVLKVRIIEESSYKPDTGSNEMGIVEEVPEVFHYFGKHSLILEQSFMNYDKTDELVQFFKSLKGKLVAWEAVQDRGRTFKEGDNKYVFLKASDVLAYADEVDEDVESNYEDPSKGGSFATS